VIDLRSDTKTRPTAAMRQAIATADVGDEQAGEDPTVCALESRVAALLGQEAAVFLPSGTMCNAIAFRLHVRPGGDEVILDRSAHPVRFEAGGPAALSGAMLYPLDSAGGIFGPDDVAAALRPVGSRQAPRSRMVSIEQATSAGRVWPARTIRAVLEVARAHQLRAHLDGARLFNAAVAANVPVSEFSAGLDTVWVDFSKGLGAPVGAVLAGSQATITEARRYKQMFGGAMRQAGILAAAGLYALDHHVTRLAEDHHRARMLADGLAAIPGVSLDPGLVEINIVVFAVADAKAFCAALASRGVLMSATSERLVRAVTHLDVSTADVEQAVDVAESLLQ
jgi:threonine aldolase